MNVQTPFQQMVEAYAPDWMGEIEAVLRCYMNTGDFFEVPLTDAKKVQTLGSDLATLCGLRVYVANPTTGEEIYRVPSRFADIDRAMMQHPGEDKPWRKSAVMHDLNSRAADGRLTSEELAAGYTHLND